MFEVFDFCGKAGQLVEMKAKPDAGRNGSGPPGGLLS